MRRKKVLRSCITVVLLLSLFCSTVFSVSAEENVADSGNSQENNMNNSTVGEESEDDVLNNETGNKTDLEDNVENGEIEGANDSQQNNNEGNLMGNTEDDDSTQTIEDERQEDSLENFPDEENIETEKDGIFVKYRTHVSKIGWQDYVTNGTIAGTVGKNLPMEALSIELEGGDYNKIDGLGVEYEAHVSDIGWQEPVKNGAVSGTTGKAKAMEAIRIRLIGDLANNYDVYYRVHSAEYGWFDWAKNGEIAGSIGFAYAMQAIEIKIFLKESPDKPVTKGKTYLAEDNMGDVIYQAHVQDKGWGSKKVDGQEAGSSAENKNLEAIKIDISESAKHYGELSGTVEYEVHVRDIGWQDPVKDGQQAGTTGKNTPIEAIKITLTDQLSEAYDIYYRVYSENHGWFGWAKNGELAGSIGFAYSTKSIEIRLCDKDSLDKPETTEPSYLAEDNMGKIVYKTHVQNKGWQKSVTDGANAGTTGKGLGVEAITISVTDFWRDENLAGSIFYQAHVSGIGWQDEVSDGAIAGTTAQNRRIEAIRIRLTDQLQDNYDIYYRVHSSNFGWLDWAKNGEIAGSTGYGSSIEAIQIQLFEKNGIDIPDSDGRTYLSREQISAIDVQEHIEASGWQAVKNRKELIVGTTGQNRSIEAIAMAVKPIENSYSGGIAYRAYVSDTGWQGWASDGNISGTTGQANRIEAIQIKLTGEMEKYCDIYYRTHVTDFGWLGWTKNGQSAGTSGYAYKLQAIEIKIVPKYTPAPGSMENAFKQAPPTPVRLMLQRANLYNSSTPYIILVDRSRHKVGIFQGWQGNWSNIAFWDCSDGAPSTPTVEGVFRVGSRGYYFDSGSSRCYWYTQFYGNYLFHSVLYSKYTGGLVDGRLGMALSHGCVRLDINNAKWIYDNIPTGTTVVVYH